MFVGPLPTWLRPVPSAWVIVSRTASLTSRRRHRSFFFFVIVFFEAIYLLSTSFEELPIRVGFLFEPGFRIRRTRVLEPPPLSFRCSDGRAFFRSIVTLPSGGAKEGTILPELLTEFMVEMSCEGCVKSVKTKLEGIEGVKSVDVDLGNQIVKVLGSLPVKTLAEALEQTGRKARLIGQGVPEGLQTMT
ncbi:unnamed protein product [Cuscuta campestris]|uniref:HMA domain-containing protein n=1 Tax=Cuscuta campestris TaxID=132261 RepID=A0A484NQP5_9ASTE|nr:unnamed protein product [Cuscuta campestris]